MAAAPPHINVPDSKCACQSSSAVAASKSTKSALAASAAREGSGGSKRCTARMSKAGLGQRAATSAGRQPGGFSQTRNLSPQDAARQLSSASSR